MGTSQEPVNKPKLQKDIILAPAYRTPLVVSSSQVPSPAEQSIGNMSIPTKLPLGVDGREVQTTASTLNQLKLDGKRSSCQCRSPSQSVDPRNHLKTRDWPVNWGLAKILNVTDCN